MGPRLPRYDPIRNRKDLELNLLRELIPMTATLEGLPR